MIAGIIVGVGGLMACVSLSLSCAVVASAVDVLSVVVVVATLSELPMRPMSLVPSVLLVSGKLAPAQGRGDKELTWSKSEPTNGEGGELEEDGDRSTSAIVRLSITIVATVSIDASIVAVVAIVSIVFVNAVVASVREIEGSGDGSVVLAYVVTSDNMVGGNNMTGTRVGAGVGSREALDAVELFSFSSTVRSVMPITVEMLRQSTVVCSEPMSVSVGIIGAGPN